MITGINRIRELVRARDNHTCQQCGKVYIERKIISSMRKAKRFDVHHLDKHRENLKGKEVYSWDKNNMDRLITLCHRCHFNIDLEKIKNNLPLI